jgi:hypothetical protein
MQRCEIFKRIGNVLQLFLFDLLQMIKTRVEVGYDKTLENICKMVQTYFENLQE